MSGPLAVGVDVGGTKVAALLTDDRGTVLDRKVVHSPASDAEATVATVVSLARDLAAANEGVIAVGIGAAGLVSREGVMRFAPNIAWREFPIGERVADGVGLPVLVDNDANVAAWGEFKYGAGRGTNHLLLVTVGTGIGGGIVADGSLYRGAHGFAAEIGHIIVDPNGPVCGCGNVGCWEQVASGRAIERLGRKTAAENPDSVLGRAAAGNPMTIDGPAVTKAAQEGDPMSLRILEIVGVRLGEGIAGLVNVLDPDVVVVGGERRRRAICCLNPPAARSSARSRRRSTARRSRSCRRRSATTPAPSARPTSPAPRPWGRRSDGRPDPGRAHPAPVLGRPGQSARRRDRRRTPRLRRRVRLRSLLPPGAPSDRASLELFTTLAAAAAITERLTVGSLVTRAVPRPPGLVAKMAATIDAVAGGRRP